MTIWTDRGKDQSGSACHVATNTRGTHLVTDHPIHGVSLWSLSNGLKTHIRDCVDVQSAKDFAGGHFE